MPPYGLEAEDSGGVPLLSWTPVPEPHLVVDYVAKEEPTMKKRLQKKLELSRETLWSLAEVRLPEVAGGFSYPPTCPAQCGSDANTVCFATCACTSPAFCE
jgi:hypothetical protein